MPPPGARRGTTPAPQKDVRSLRTWRSRQPPTVHGGGGDSGIDRGQPTVVLLTFLIYSFYTLYSVFDACGLKILPQVAVVEIFPSRTCALGVSMAFATNWLAFNLVFFLMEWLKTIDDIDAIPQGMNWTPFSLPMLVFSSISAIEFVVVLAVSVVVIVIAAVVADIVSVLSVVLSKFKIFGFPTKITT